jgi:CRISPR/Cas system-associated protein Cas10 (large subunit of type III CRISPR-Cas system)
MKFEFSNLRFPENPSSGAEFFHEVIQTDRQEMTKLMEAFGNFTKAPKNAHQAKAARIYRNTRKTLSCKRILLDVGNFAM